MIEKALNSMYVIDGIQQEFSPIQILNEVCYQCLDDQEAVSDTIIDETIDSIAKPQEPDDTQLDNYICLQEQSALLYRDFPLCYPSSYTRFKLAHCLLQTLINRDSVRLQDIQLSVDYHWQENELGAMAAFYNSIKNISDYMDNLNLYIDNYSYQKADKCQVEFCANIDGQAISQNNKYQTTFVQDNNSWIIYMPFDTADYRLGGSLLSRCLGVGVAEPIINDADYFVDCYEVVKELVEDGILLSIDIIEQGGLIATLKKMCADNLGLKVDLSGILNSYNETSRTRVLMSEIPGVVFQIKDSDFDYIDAQLLLQDVAFFPLGHPDKTLKGIVVDDFSKPSKLL